MIGLNLLGLDRLFECRNWSETGVKLELPPPPPPRSPDALNKIIVRLDDDFVKRPPSFQELLELSVLKLSVLKLFFSNFLFSNFCSQNFPGAAVCAQLGAFRYVSRRRHRRSSSSSMSSSSVVIVIRRVVVGVGVGVGRRGVVAF